MAVLQPGERPPGPVVDVSALSKAVEQTDQGVSLDLLVAEQLSQGIILDSLLVNTTLVKTSTFVGVDAWQAVAVDSVMVGNVVDVSGVHKALAHVETALTSTNAHALGPKVQIWTSPSGVGDWTKLTEVRGTAEAAATSTINDATVDAGDTTITLTDATTGDFKDKLRKWYIKDGTIANSESVVTQSNATHLVTLLTPLVRAHADSLNVYDRVDDYVPIIIPKASPFYFVVVFNDDADATIDARSWVEKVTAE